MFIGHYALALGAKKIAPEASLGSLFVACQLADLLWPNLVLLGIERFAIEPGATAFTPLDFIHYPYSHSLLALALWGIAFGFIYHALRHAPWRVSVVLAVLVLSHWLLDAISHRPDMPLVITDGPKVGLNLWRSVPATLLVEFALLALGALVYARATVARDHAGAIGFYLLAAFLSAIEILNAFSPPPPSVAAVAWTAQSMWLIVLWGWWVDRHRAVGYREREQR